MTYKVVPVASLWDPNDDEKPPVSQLEAQLNAAEAKGWRLVLVIPRHKARELYAEDSDPEGPWLVLRRKAKAPKA
jgi:hypothetical protein